MRIFWVSVMLIAALLTGAQAVSAGQRRPAPTRAYVVKPGDNLWKIARTLPARGDTRQAVFRLMKLNDLSAPTLRPGQMLQIPLR